MTPQRPALRVVAHGCQQDDGCVRGQCSVDDGVVERPAAGDREPMLHVVLDAGPQAMHGQVVIPASAANQDTRVVLRRAVDASNPILHGAAYLSATAKDQRLCVRCLQAASRGRVSDSALAPGRQSRSPLKTYTTWQPKLFLESVTQPVRRARYCFRSPSDGR